MQADKYFRLFLLKHIRIADGVYFGMVAAICSLSAAFPVYVHLHPDEFGPPVMQFYGSVSETGSVNLEAVAVKAKIVAQIRPRLELDKMMTGSIQPNMSAVPQPALDTTPYQPFPDAAQIPTADPGLLFVGPNRVLAFDGGRIVSLRTGSRLADGSQIVEILRIGNRWTIRTSSGKELEWSARP